MRTDELMSETAAKSGPGLWLMLHVYALMCDRGEGLPCIPFPSYVQLLCRLHPCDDCAVHCREYSERHPPARYVDTSVSTRANGIVSDSCFYWSWKFHNAVNSRLGKGSMPYAEALSLYEQMMQGQRCHARCAVSPR